MRRALFWLAFNIPMGKLSPWVMGLALGRKPVRMTQEETDRLEAKRRNAMVDKGMEGGNAEI